VVEAAEEEVGEELHGGVELGAGLAGWGNNQRWLSLTRCSQRKMMAGKSCGLASLAGAAGRPLVQEGRSDNALLLVWSDSSEAAHLQLEMANEATASVEQSSEEAGRTVEGRSKVGGGFLGDVRSRGNGGQPTWDGDDQRPPMPSAPRVVGTVTGNKVACGTERPSWTVKQKWAADRWSRPGKINFQTLLKFANSKR
jgi:hypothetical protein